MFRILSVLVKQCPVTCVLYLPQTDLGWNKLPRLKQTDLGWNKLTWVETNWPEGSIWPAIDTSRFVPLSGFKSQRFLYEGRVSMKVPLCQPWEQGWCIGESTRLPPTWPGFDPSLNTTWVKNQQTLMGWVCRFSSLLWKVFPLALQFSPLIKNQTLH